MSGTSYAAVLREVARDVKDASQLGLHDPRAKQLFALADLLERVTPEGVERLYRAVVVMSIAPSVPMDLMAAIRALATGPQGEATTERRSVRIDVDKDRFYNAVMSEPEREFTTFAPAATAPAHRHRCLRCGEEFECQAPGLCKAAYDVLPTIITLGPDGQPVLTEHCPHLAPKHPTGPQPEEGRDGE